MEREELKLSDAYTVECEEPWLELKVLVLNINPGYNSGLLDSCKTLKDYSEYTARVRKYAQEEDVTIRQAVERAIQECIQEGILSEYLSKHRAEAIKMSIYEYDEEKHMRQEREEWWQKGMEAGRSEGERKGRLKSRIEDILDILRELGDIPAELEETIAAQEDPDVLKKWHLAAARANSIEEFKKSLTGAP